MRTDIGNRITKLEKRLCPSIKFPKITILHQHEYETDEEYEADLEMYRKAGYQILINSITNPNIKRGNKKRGQDLAENGSNYR